MAEFTADFHGYSMSYFSLSDDMFCAYETPENPRNSEEIFPESNQISRPILSTETESHETRKRSSGISTPQASENGIKRKKSSVRGKRVKSDEREEEKSGEIVLVRARRGQATDSHSLAERARRGKINERLRFLQDIVPGCYKSMGMAVMLDEIINYVQSLQNQIEFLSMKLAAASSFSDSNSQTFASQNDPRSGGEEDAKELRERHLRLKKGARGGKTTSRLSNPPTFEKPFKMCVANSFT